LIQYSDGNDWVHSAIIREIGQDGKIYVAEHSGNWINNDWAGNSSYTIHGDDLSRKRTFWIGG
jgi:hypothetical protein